MDNNHEISLQQAIDMTTLYRSNRPGNFPLCETFDIEAVNKLLSLEGCVSLRIYFGMKDDMKVDVILVAVNSAGQDLLPDDSLATANNDNVILLEDGLRCPPDCPPKSKLNS